MDESSFTDQVLTCRDCGNTFVWTAAEQKFYAEKGFANAPVRCPEDRAKKKAAMGGGFRGGYGGGPRPMFDAVCSVCGKPCQVPFQPRLGEDGKPIKPIYCNEHYQQMKDGGTPQAN